MITFIKKSPEKFISCFLLVVFIFLSSYLVIGWFGRKPIVEEIVAEERPGEPLVKAVVAVDIKDLLTRKPVAYYDDLKQRNPFVRLPGVIGIEKHDDHVPVETRLIYRGIMVTPEYLLAFVEGRATHLVREGDEIEGWRIIKIAREEMLVYNKSESREFLLPVGGGPEERERLRREAAERRERVLGMERRRPGMERRRPAMEMDMDMEREMMMREMEMEMEMMMRER